jgi:hypothetical protein
LGNPLGKQRRRRRKVSQCRKQPGTGVVPSETIEKIIHLHDVEHKGFRKVADVLGMDKDRVHRIYKKNAATFEKQRQTMFSQDSEYMALKKTEQEIARKTKRAQAIEETRQKIRDLHIQRAQTSVGLEEIFSSPKDILEFAEQTVDQCKPLKLFCSKHNLPPDKTLADLVGSKEDYLKTAEEEGGVQDLSEYINSSIDSFLMDQAKEEEKQRLKRSFIDFIANFRCSNCGANIKEFEINFNELVCKKCQARCKIPCPKCKTALRVNATGGYVTEYRCPSCEFTLKAAEWACSARGKVS